MAQVTLPEPRSDCHGIRPFQMGGNIPTLRPGAKECLGKCGLKNQTIRLIGEDLHKAAATAKLVLAVIDGNSDSGADVEQILRTAEQAEHGIVVISKTDLPQRFRIPETKLPLISVSSVTGEGLELLEEKISALFPLPQVPAGEILTNVRQADAVRRAAENMEAACEALEAGMTPDIILTETENAMQALGELTGASIREDVTNQIFARFCVGK